MASIVLEKDENVHKQYENTSGRDHNETQRKGPIGQLPPIKLGMSFSDWKQMKETEQTNSNITQGRCWKPPVQRQQNNRTNREFFDNMQSSQHNNSHTSSNYQQNFPNLNTFKPQRNQYSGCNPSQSQMISSKIPPLQPPPSFEDIEIFDENEWSSGPLMQPMFPPMPRIPPLNRGNNMSTNNPKQQNNQFLGRRRISARFKPKSGESDREIQSHSTEKEQREENATSPQVTKTQPQIYFYKPCKTNANEKSKSNWIVKPMPPEHAPTDTPEDRAEKARLWREYRKAMKPFKHRVFSNAKRVIQRLGKKNYDELDEKDRGRLDRAKEYVSAHKALLNSRFTKTTSAEAEPQLIHKQINSELREDERNSSDMGGNKQTNESLWANSYVPMTYKYNFVSGGIFKPGSITTNN